MIDMEDYLKAIEIGNFCRNLDDAMTAQELCNRMTDRARMVAAAIFVLAVVEHSNMPVDTVLESLGKVVKERLNNGRENDGINNA